MTWVTAFRKTGKKAFAKLVFSFFFAMEIIKGPSKMQEQNYGNESRIGKKGTCFLLIIIFFILFILLLVWIYQMNFQLSF